MSEKQSPTESYSETESPESYSETESPTESKSGTLVDFNESTDSAPTDSKTFERSESPRYLDIFQVSPSVAKAVDRLGADTEVTAQRFVTTILAEHGEYGGQRAASIKLEETRARKTPQRWLDEIEELFDPAGFRNSSRQPELHGRLVVIGLALLEPELRKQMQDSDFFDAIVSELHEPIDEILTPLGRDTFEPIESVPNWSDDPVTDPDLDLLGRYPFARFLSQRIFAIAPESDAYAIHIFGPWGAGKTTLLNFLKTELESKHRTPRPMSRLEERVRRIFRIEQQKKSEWIVVEFNAWRHQHIQPPWWSLMERVFQSTKKRLTLRNRFSEYWWRLNTGKSQYFLAFAVIAWIIALIIIPALSDSSAKPGPLKSLADGADYISKILALIATVWGGVFAFQRSLFFSSAKAAQNYAELVEDPANQIKRRFSELINRLRPSRVAIFVDDLDRCQGQYVVDLLEGIQTLFRDAPVVFVITADRKWLNACYEEVYEKLKPHINAPGKPLGTLFLEKAFRFSTPMPGIPQQLRDEFWQHLLNLGTREGKAELEEARAKASNLVVNTKSEAEVRKLVRTANADDDRSFSEKRAIREAAAVRLAAPTIIRQIEHTLRPYASLLEPNPRAMKLLVNSYSANRALSILSEVNIELHQLALCTILTGRWPQLADHLIENPGALLHIRNDETKALPASFRILAASPAVKSIIGNSADGLTSDTLEKCGQMRT